LRSISNKVWLVIPAAGIGQRMQSAIPKQYIKIHNKTILEHTLGCFLEHEKIAGIVVVLASHDKYWDSLIIKNSQKKPFDSLLELCDLNCVGGLLASPVRDTMKRSVADPENSNVKKPIVSNTESRENLWHAQTPQMFRLGEIKSAIEQCRESNFDITDECSAMEFVGEAPVIIESVYNNIKVTSPSDIRLAEFLISEREFE